MIGVGVREEGSGGDRCMGGKQFFSLCCIAFWVNGFVSVMEPSTAVWLG